MAFTQVTITGGPFLRPDGQPASGTITATLSEALTNGAEQVDPTPILGTLNALGMLVDDSGLSPFVLLATTDPATLPAGAVYGFVLDLDSAPVDPFTAAVPYSAPARTVDLSTLGG